MFRVVMKLGIYGCFLFIFWIRESFSFQKVFYFSNRNPSILLNNNNQRIDPIFGKHDFNNKKLSYIPVTLWGKGFGSDSASSKKKKTIATSKQRLISALDDDVSKNDKRKQQQQGNATPYNKSKQEELVLEITKKAEKTCIGQVVLESKMLCDGTDSIDTFWEMIPTLLLSRFPNVRDTEMQRIAGFIRHTLHPDLVLESEIIENPYRPQKDIHAYMPGLGVTKAFYEPSEFVLCQLLHDNYDTIKKEYDALVDYIENSPPDRTGTNNNKKPIGFQSVTSMNYDSGWKTLVLYYNGHRIDGFPYHLCPRTCQIMETVPLAGRIAGFNRQQPQTGIPLHTDGNNMWLTCQMGLYVPEKNQAFIQVGPDTRYWKEGECIVYDTTYEHETKNQHTEQERVVLHIDFFNILKMTKVEIDVMQYIYDLREQYMKAEGVAKVGAQIL